LTLLPRGMTPKRFSELSRYAFAHAAVKISQQSNGKVNYSRVAALTGLSRADVKRLLKNKEFPNFATRSSQMPIERVLSGWRSDRRFVDKSGNPKRLKISGSPISFALLTRVYGGDVPHRAVLDELCRIGAVRRDGENVVPTALRHPPSRRRFASLSSVLPAIIDGIRLAAPEASRISPSIYRLTIPAKSELDGAIVRERCLSTVTTMLDGLGESLGGHFARGNRRGEAHSFVVTVLLTERRVNKSVQLNVRGDRPTPRRTLEKILKTSSAGLRE